MRWPEKTLPIVNFKAFWLWYGRVGREVVAEFLSLRPCFGPQQAVWLDLRRTASARRCDKVAAREVTARMVQDGVLRGEAWKDRADARLFSLDAERIRRHPGLQPQEGDKMQKVGRRIDARVVVRRQPAKWGGEEVVWRRPGLTRERAMPFGRWTTWTARASLVEGGEAEAGKASPKKVAGSRPAKPSRTPKRRSR